MPSSLTRVSHAPGPSRLLVSCPDRPGIVAAIAGFLYSHGANILTAGQHTTHPTEGTFFMRVEFALPASVSRETFEAGFAEQVAAPFGMDWRVSYGTVKRMAVLVSRYDHCLIDLLWRQRKGDLDVEIPLVASNHPDLEEDARFFGIPYHHLPITPETKAEQEARLQALLEAERIDVVVLARYMQVLSEGFVARWPNRIINIHHSFLPAFVGASPYKAAFERGVKIIGATAHYVTSDLDQGPIIEQDVVRVSHRDSLEDLVRLGRDCERQVLSRAVRWHLEERVIVHGNKTVVF